MHAMQDPPPTFALLLPIHFHNIHKEFPAFQLNAFDSEEYLGYPVKESLRVKLVAMRKGVRRLFCESGPMVGTETKTLRNCILPDALDLVQEDVTLHASKITTLDCSSVYARYEITGTYSTMMPEELEESLVITTSGCWQKISETSALKPFRFYLTISSREGSPLEVENDALSRIRISVRGEDDNATGIQDVFSGVQEQAPVFDLSGRRVYKPAKGGIYISNGRKLIY